MTSSKCDRCGASTLTLRAGARYCSTKCRVYAAREAKRGLILPPEMTQRARFVRYTDRKVPRTIDGQSASSTDPTTWSTFSDAAASTVGEGVGFVLGAGIGCIDLDHALHNGVVDDWAQLVLDSNPDTYVEISRSGEGLHIFGLLNEAPGRKIRDGRNIEVYSAGRYIALTGKRHGASPATLALLVVPAK
jgi:primase-polymerase (primpol)-like protein